MMRTALTLTLAFNLRLSMLIAADAGQAKTKSPAPP
jgi:hypothetical protein